METGKLEQSVLELIRLANIDFDDVGGLPAVRAAYFQVGEALGELKALLMFSDLPNQMNFNSLSGAEFYTAIAQLELASLSMKKASFNIGSSRL